MTAATTASVDLRSLNRPSRPGVGRGLLLLCIGVLALVACASIGGLASIVTTLPTLLVLLLLYLPVVAWAARTEPDQRLAKVMWLGLGARLVGYVARYTVMTNVYGTGDAKSYHSAGAELARSYRNGNFAAPVPGGGGGQGTFSVRVITGFIYSVTGSSLLVGALVFTLLSFSGVLLLVKAFRIGVPDGDHLRYGRLLLLLPSMWFWPSSIGKEPWMLFGLGVLAYGAARVYRRAPGGLVLVIAGGAACAYVRPHIAAAATAAATAALVFRYRREDRRFNRIGKVLILVPLVLGSLVLVGRAQEYLKVDNLTILQVREAGQQAGAQSGQGGSQFTPTPVGGVHQLPVAAVTVLFRPFPIEARSALSLAISLEGTFLMVLALRSWRRILGGFRALRRTSYLALCVMTTVALVVGFSNFANFGLLARERVQALPFFLALLAATRGGARNSGDGLSEPAAEPEEPLWWRRRNTLRWRVPDAPAS